MNLIDKCDIVDPTGDWDRHDGFGVRCGREFPCELHPPEWRSHHWGRLHPIFYKPEDLKAGVLPEDLIQKLRSELAHIRGKLSDIASGYGWDDRLETPEHGITLVISNLHHVIEEMARARQSPMEFLRKLDTKP